MDKYVRNWPFSGQNLSRNNDFFTIFCSKQSGFRLILTLDPPQKMDVFWGVNFFWEGPFHISKHYQNFFGTSYAVTQVTEKNLDIPDTHRPRTAARFVGDSPKNGKNEQKLIKKFFFKLFYYVFKHDEHIFLNVFGDKKNFF